MDALKGDSLGRLGLTECGLAQRDKMVIGQVRERYLPLVITLGGGYAKPIELTVAAHAQTFRTAADLLL